MTTTGLFFEILSQNSVGEAAKAREALSGGAAARMIAAEVSTKNAFFSLRGPAKALPTASAEGAS